RTDWQFTMQQAEGGDYNWVLETGLRGVTIDLPPPLAKKPETSLPLRVERQGIDKTHDRLLASLGPIAQMEAIRLVTEKGPEVQKMAFSLGRTPARAERDGLWIRGNVDNIEVEPWLAIAQSMNAGGDRTPAAAATDIGFAGIDVRAESSVIYGRRLKNLRVEARNQAGNWKIDLDSDDVTGAVSWQPTKSGDSGLITARLKKLALPPEETGPGGAAIPPPVRKELPALDVIADSYVSKGRDIGRVELKARPA